MRAKLKCIPFNIDVAKKITEGKINGAKIITRDKHAVRILTYDMKGNFPIVAVITYGDKKEEVNTFQKNGSYLDSKKHSKDLVLLIPNRYNYIDFTPKKYQSVLVRDFNDDQWVAQVASGTKNKNGYEVISMSLPNTQTFYLQCLPIDNTTIKLLGTAKSYNELS